MSLFHKAQKAGMLPAFPAGMLVHLGQEPAAYSFFVQVLHPLPGDQQIVRIPKGTFSCMQITLVSRLDIPKLIREHFGPVSDKPVILHNILRDTHHFASRYMEMQVAMDGAAKSEF